MWLFNDEDKNSHDPSLLLCLDWETPGGRNYTQWSNKLDVSVQIECCHVICLKGHHFFAVRVSRPVSHAAVWTGVTSLKWVLARDSCTQSQGTWEITTTVNQRFMTRRSQSVHIKVTRGDAVECSHDSMLVGFVGVFFKLIRSNGKLDHDTDAVKHWMVSEYNDPELWGISFRSVSVKTEHGEAAFSFSAPTNSQKTAGSLQISPL